MDTLDSIPKTVESCAQAFVSLEDSLTLSPRYALQVKPALVTDQLDRLRLWAGNVAAHRKGHRSLEWRLRDAQQLRNQVLDLLVSLRDTITQAVDIVQGKSTPWDEESESDSDTDMSDAYSGRFGEDRETELKQLYAKIVSDITTLMRLAMAIREPALDSEGRTMSKSYYQQRDEKHVQEKFPNMPIGYLTERLGRAITSRRQYIADREAHQQKLSERIELLGLQDLGTEHGTSSTEATKMQEPGAHDLVPGGEDDTLSQTSYATSVNATIRAPRLPKIARSKDEYQCPLCCRLVACHTKRAWKSHIYQDLYPYCCTFETCAIADRLYDSRRAWFQHELEAHRMVFECIQGCSKLFQNELAFKAHVAARHSTLSSPEAFGILKRTSARIADLSERVTCPACQKTMSLRALQKHLAHHQEELALFAIPSYEEESDDQAEDQTQIPPNSEEESDKGLTDVDDVSDPEEERDKKAIDIQPRSFNDQDDIPRSGNLSVFNLSERWKSRRRRDPSFKKGDTIQMEVLDERGKRVKFQRFAIAGVRYDDLSGAWLYQLEDKSGRLYRNGLWVSGRRLVEVD